MENQDLTPKPKVAAGGIAGAVAVLILAITNLFGLQVPQDMVNDAVLGFGSLVVLVQFVAAYMKKETK